jgi:hypothetical protein
MVGYLRGKLHHSICAFPLLSYLQDTAPLPFVNKPESGMLQHGAVKRVRIA